MIYIQGTEHDKIHDSNRDKLYILEICDNNGINFVSILDEKNKINCIPDHCLFNIKWKDNMLKMNKELLKNWDKK